jgi:hypothetical protein
MHKGTSIFDINVTALDKKEASEEIVSNFNFYQMEQKIVHLSSVLQMSVLQFRIVSVG